MGRSIRILSSNRLVAIGAALLLASCAAPPVSSADAPSFGEVKIHFMAAQDDQVIEARALDRRAITAAELVYPDGTRVPAYSIDADADPVINDVAAISAAGMTPAASSTGVPMPAGIAQRSSTTLVGEIASSALIRVPEPALYAQLWQHSTIEVRLGTGPDAIRQTNPAPAPL